VWPSQSGTVPHPTLQFGRWVASAPSPGRPPAIDGEPHELHDRRWRPHHQLIRLRRACMAAFREVRGDRRGPGSRLGRGGGGGAAGDGEGDNECKLE